MFFICHHLDRKFTGRDRIGLITGSHQTVWAVQSFVVVFVLLFYVHGKHLRSCRDGQLT